MRVNYESGSLELFAETMSEALTLATAAWNANTAGYPLAVESGDYDGGVDQVWLTIALRQRAPSEKRGKGEKTPAAANGTPTPAPEAPDREPRHDDSPECRPV